MVPNYIIRFFFYTKLKVQTEDQINKRAIPKNNLNFSDCLANNLNFFRLFNGKTRIIIKQIRHTAMS